MKTLIPMFQRFGSFLAVGEEGAALRFSEVEPSISKGHQVVFDMEGVTNMTDSFANTCFTTLFVHLDNQIQGKVSFANCSPLIKSFIQTSLARAQVLAKRQSGE